MRTQTDATSGCTLIEETVRAFNTIIDRGYAHYWELASGHLATRLGLQGPVVEQPQFDRFVRDNLESEYAPLYHLYRYSTTIWSPPS